LFHLLVPGGRWHTVIIRPAVHTIATWWAQVGSVLHPGATRLLICADGGGSNGYRTRAWKTELADLAAVSWSVPTDTQPVLAPTS